MDNTNKIEETRSGFKIYAVGVLLLAFAGAALRTFCLLFYYDKDIGYFKSGAAAPKAATAMYIIVAVFFAAAAIIVFGKQKIRLTREPGHALKLTGIAATLSLIITSVFLFIELSADGYVLPQLMLVIVILSFLSCFYFLVVHKRDEENFGAKLILGFTLVFRMILSLGYAYFDMTVQMNSPNKIIYQVAVLTSLLYFINEFRLLSGKPRSRFYIFAASLAIYFLAVSSIPSIIAYFSGVFENKTYFFFDIVMFFIMLYISVTLVKQAFGNNFMPEGKAFFTKETEEEIPSAEETAVIEEADEAAESEEEEEEEEEITANCPVIKENIGTNSSEIIETEENIEKS